MKQRNWSDAEIDLIVTDYFDMLRMDFAGESFVKSRRNADLQELISRTHSSIEFKHQNISAVLTKLGWPWLKGYAPRFNFQKALVEGVERHLEMVGGLAIPLRQAEQSLQDETMLFIGPAPELVSKEIEHSAPLKRLIRKFDPALRDASNRKLGLLGEECAYFSERSRLKAEGRGDLARRVRWISQEDGDGAGYDILSFDRTGRERLLEVKTTTGHERTPFYISANELAVSKERSREYTILRLFDFARSPKAFEIYAPVENSLRLEESEYRASFI